MRMAFTAPFGFILAAATLAVAATDDKQGKDQAKPAEMSPDYATLGSVVGAKVSMLPGEKAKNEAKKENESAAKPIGKVTDILLDCCSGEVRWAVVEFDKTLGFGGKSVAIPCDQLRWNTVEESFDLSQTDEQLKALPKFDRADAKKNGLDLSVATLAPYWPNTKVRDVPDRSKEAPPTIEIDGKKFECAKPQLVLASDVTGDALYANSEKFGTVSSGIVDRANRKLAFLIVKHGGTLGVGETEFLIPFYAACARGGEHGTEMVYTCLRSVKELEAGVMYKKPENGAVDAEAVRRAHELFAAEAPKKPAKG